MNRINELARASKERALDDDEKREQAALRAEYLEKFREGFRAQLEQIEIVDEIVIEEEIEEEIELLDDLDEAARKLNRKN